MCGLQNKILCFALVLCSSHLSSSSTLDLRQFELEGESVGVPGISERAGSYYYEDEFELSVGAIIGIGIAVIFVFFGIPILICFCCACCCFRYRRNKSTVVVAPMPQQYAPQQYNNAAMHHQSVNITNHTNGPPQYPTNQNAYRDNLGFIPYPGNGDNTQANQSTNQYYNYNGGPPPPNPRFTNNQTHNYEQRPPPYFNVSTQSAEPYQIPRSTFISNTVPAKTTNS